MTYTVNKKNQKPADRGHKNGSNWQIADRI